MVTACALPEYACVTKDVIVTNQEHTEAKQLDFELPWSAMDYPQENEMVIYTFVTND